MKREKVAHVSVEYLEDRITPSFNSWFTPTLGTTLTQVIDSGDVTISIDALSSQILLNEGSGTVSLGPIGPNLTINMLPSFDDALTVENSAGLAGNLTIRLGNNSSLLELDGGLIQGNLQIFAGNGDQFVLLGADGSPLSIGGSANINLGSGNDLVLHDGDLSVGSNLAMTGVNFFNDFADDFTASLSVGGNLDFNVGNENVISQLNLDFYASLLIGNNLNYYGSNDADFLFTLENDFAFIGRNVYANLRNDLSGGGQIAEFDAVTIGGNLTVIGGSGIDAVVSNDLTVVGGNVYVNTGTAGDDVVELAGTLSGRSVTVLTGTGNDTFDYLMTGSPARLFASLGLGDDSVNLDALPGAALGYLYLDFGFGNDTFNPLGFFTFPAVLRNLP